MTNYNKKNILVIVLCIVVVFVVPAYYYYMHKHETKVEALHTTDKIMQIGAAQVEAEVKKRVEDGFAVGMALSMMDVDRKDGELEYSAYNAIAGTLGLNNFSPVTEDTLFQIGSISKTFTGILLALAILEQNIALEDDANKYLPEGYKLPTFQGKEIKIKHLVTHTSGLASVPSNVVIVDPHDVYAGYGWDSYAELLKNNQEVLLFEPGTQFNYSNAGMAVLGYILSLINGSSFEYLITEKIFRPLGMSDSMFKVIGEDRLRLAIPYSGEQQVGYWHFEPFFYATGGIISTLSDMKKYLRAHLECKYKMSGDKTNYNLYDAIYMAQQPVITASGYTIAMAWAVDTEHGILRHAGGTGGFASFMAMKPSEGKGGVLLSNSTYSNDDIVYTALGGYASFRNLPQEVEQQYAGYYESSIGLFDVVEVNYVDNSLSINVGYAENMLYLNEDGSFFSKGINGTFRFQKGEDGSGYELVYNNEGVAGLGAAHSVGKKIFPEDDRVKNFTAVVKRQN